MHNDWQVGGYEHSHSVQESIPVGCVLPTLVATTRCQYLSPGYIPPLGIPTPSPMSTPQEETWYQRYLPQRPPSPQKGPGTKDT